MGPLIVIDSLEVILELYSFICSEGWDFDKWLDSYRESIVNHPGYQGVHHSWTISRYSGIRIHLYQPGFKGLVYQEIKPKNFEINFIPFILLFLLIIVSCRGLLVGHEGNFFLNWKKMLWIIFIVLFCECISHALENIFTNLLVILSEARPEFVMALVFHPFLKFFPGHFIPLLKLAVVWGFSLNRIIS